MTVRWDDLFRDLEAQLEAAGAAELDAEVADRTRRENALLGLVDRARGAVGSGVSVRVLGAGTLAGTLREVGSQWLLLAQDGGREAVVPLTAVLAVSGLGRWSGPPATDDWAGPGGSARGADVVFARLGLSSALRGIARDRAAVAVVLVDGEVVTGTLDRVGADFVELGVHEAGEPRRREGLTGVRTIPIAAVALVRSGP